MSGAILSVEKIDVFYGASQILFGVDLEVHKGRTLALLGRNGAGKSTTLKAIAGIAPPARGAVRFEGNRPDRGRALHHFPQRDRIRPRRPAGLSRTHGRRQPDDRREARPRGRGQLDTRDGL